MILQDGTRIPLHYVNAAMWFKGSYPTLEERQTLRVVELNDDIPWDPTKENSHDKSEAIWNGYVDDEMDIDTNNPVESNVAILLSYACGLSAQPTVQDWDRIQACFAWKPLDRIKATLANTTQWAKNVVRHPMRHPFKTRFHDLNARRLNEVYATDTFFSSEKSLEGYECVQLYRGKTSNYLVIFGMHSESQMP